MLYCYWSTASMLKMPDRRLQVNTSLFSSLMRNAHHAAVEQDWRSDIKNPKGSL